MPMDRLPLEDIKRFGLTKVEESTIWTAIVIEEKSSHIPY